MGHFTQNLTVVALKLPQLGQTATVLPHLEQNEDPIRLPAPPQYGHVWLSIIIRIRFAKLL